MQTSEMKILLNLAIGLNYFSSNY